MGQPQLQIPRGTNPRVPKFAVCARQAMACSASAYSPDPELCMTSGVLTVFPLCLKDRLDVSWPGKPWGDHAGPQPMPMSLLAQLGTDLPWLQGQFEEFVLLSPVLCDPLQGQSIVNQSRDKSS